MTKDEALRMAIYALNRIRFPVGDGRNEALQACIEALEQPLTKDWKETIDERIAKDDKFKEALAQLAQEPVAIVYSMQDGYIGQMVVKDIPHKTKLYTHPAPSWQGLSDDELDEIVDSLNVSLILDCSIADFVNAIEARLKEKNN